MPGKVICIGLNYADHAAESGMEPPGVAAFAFSKFCSNVVGPGGGGADAASATSETDYEAELGVVIGRRPGEYRNRMRWITSLDTRVPTISAPERSNSPTGSGSEERVAKVSVRSARAS